LEEKEEEPDQSASALAPKTPGSDPRRRLRF
jgi:hypothetical protein